MKRDHRPTMSLLRKTLALLLATSLLATTGCMSWRPMGEGHATYYDETSLRGKELRVTYPDRVVTVKVAHVEPPMIEGTTTDEHGDSVPITLDLSDAVKAEVHVSDPHKTNKTVGITVLSVIGGGALIAGSVFLLSGMGSAYSAMGAMDNPGTRGSPGASNNAPLSGAHGEPGRGQ